jgi:hypothetical protein
VTRADRRALFVTVVILLLFFSTIAGLLGFGVMPGDRHIWTVLSSAFGFSIVFGLFLGNRIAEMVGF